MMILQIYKEHIRELELKNSDLRSAVEDLEHDLQESLNKVEELEGELLARGEVD